MLARGLALHRHHTKLTTLSVAALVALTLSIAAAVVVRPGWVFAHNPSLSAGLATIIGFSALVAASIVVMRVERTHASNDLTLAFAVSLISLTSFSIAAATLVGANLDALEWVPMPARLISGVLLILAGAPRASRLENLPGRAALGWLICVFVVALGVTGAALGELFGVDIPSWVQFATVIVYLAGAASLTRRAWLVDELVLYWFAACAVGLASSRLTLTLLPPPSESYLAPGDLLRLITAALLLMAVRTELLSRARELLNSRIDEERGRLAQEIHDGTAQELAFIVSQSRRLIGRTADRSTLETLADAGQAALADTRRTIYNLKRHRTKALSAAIAESALQATDRSGLALDLEVDHEIPVEEEVEHAILRITAEAVSNVAKHGDASTVSIRISSEDDHTVVRITDDGRGFDPHERHRRHGFGLASMVQRAEALGGRLQLESQPGRGTMIEVAI
jgi:signal transduction histidine kinase